MMKINEARSRSVKKMYAYHVVTERPMYVGQHTIFDETHRSGLFQRVYEKLEIEGSCFTGDANQQVICEMLVDGSITVIEIVKEINANMERN